MVCNDLHEFLRNIFDKWVLWSIFNVEKEEQKMKDKNRENQIKESNQVFAILISCSWNTDRTCNPYLIERRIFDSRTEFLAEKAMLDMRINGDPDEEWQEIGEKAYGVDRATLSRMVAAGRFDLPNQETQIMDTNKAATEEKPEDLGTIADAGANTGQETQFRALRTLKPWQDNPGQDAERSNAATDSATLDSLKAAGWRPSESAIVFPDNHAEYAGQVIQGNRRISLLLGSLTDKEIKGYQVPVIVHQGTVAEAILIALQDVGTGIAEKGIGDICRSIVGIMESHGFKATGIIRYLWSNARETLIRLSPAVAQVNSLDDALLKANGRMAALVACSKVAHAAPEIAEGYYDEENREVRKGRRFSKDMIVKCSKAKSKEECQAIYEAQVKKAEERESAPAAPASILTVGTVTENRLKFDSKALVTIAALFSKPEKDDETEQGRDALAELMSLDAALAAAGQ